MDENMDIDLGDLQDDEEFLEVEPMHIEVRQQDNESSQDDEAEPGEIQQRPVANKIHIRGLDNLATEDVKAFANDHYPSQEISKIEWIDDTSANLVYPTDESATEALLSFTLRPEAYHQGSDTFLQLTQAKLLSTHPHTDLHVRLALTTDVKQPRAHDASRFYLLNPDKDPREQRRSHGGRGERRGYGDRRTKRRREEEEDMMHFDESMYDDDPDTLSKRLDRPLQVRRNSASVDGRQSKRFRTGGSRSDDLFAGRLGRDEDRVRLRNRSASPIAVSEGDGRFGFGDDDIMPTKMRRTDSRGNTLLSHDDTQGTENSGKELFVSKTSRSRELFPSRTTPLKDIPVNKSTVELFPSKYLDTPFSTSPNHRRSDAFDVADEKPELLVRSNGHNEPQINGTVEGRLKSRSLAERITSGPKGSNVRQSEGFNIRGSATENPGFSIKGAAKAVNPRVRELFPERNADNNGKELFNGVNRGVRRKAEDLFE